MIFFRGRDQVVKLCLNLLLGLVFYNEFLVYYIPYYFTWPKVQCGDTKDFQRVLFVADPQILGERMESWIARWDSDRFLAHTFDLAVRHVQPTLIVFLGDLMDEGSIASVEEYVRYYRRFNKIYKLRSFPTNTTVFIPGDNDIGGEDEEVTSSKVKRYYNHFHQPESLDYDNIRFIKVNKLLKTYPVMTESNNKQLVRVVLSHVPLFGAASYFSGQIVTAVRPHVIFSAHDHKSVHFVGKSDTGERTVVEELISNPFAEGSPTWRFQISDSLINEIVVPTCSYRMGVMNIGFGVGLLGGRENPTRSEHHTENNKRSEVVCYSVLWLPKRLYSLFLYLYIVPALVLLLVWPYFLKLFCRRRFNQRVYVR